VNRAPGQMTNADASYRTRLLDGAVALAEDACYAEAPRGQEIVGFSDQFQVAFPYRGVLVWHVGCDDVVGDANQVLFVSGGERYRLSEPRPGGFSELVITPRPDVLAEITQTADRDLRDHPLFRRRSRRADPRLQSLRTRFLYWAGDPSEADPLAAEVLLVELVRTALVDDAPRDHPAASSRRLIRRTKEYLEAELASPIRLHHVGHAVGASPAYLTDLFRRVEGISLHRYVVQLRLARALVELPHTDDLSTLALDVGFSSHSHFSAAFRRAFGCTPSEFRQTTRARKRPSST
jgi:AraC family transcriptional regulator